MRAVIGIVLSFLAELLKGFIAEKERTAESEKAGAATAQVKQEAKDDEVIAKAMEARDNVVPLPIRPARVPVGSTPDPDFRD